MIINELRKKKITYILHLIPLRKVLESAGLVIIFTRPRQQEYDFQFPQSGAR